MLLLLLSLLLMLMLMDGLRLFTRVIQVLSFVSIQLFLATCRSNLVVYVCGCQVREALTTATAIATATATTTTTTTTTRHANNNSNTNNHINSNANKQQIIDNKAQVTTTNYKEAAMVLSSGESLAAS